MLELSSRPLLNTRLDQPLFVDREPALNQLKRSVESGLNALMLGERGAGKTSLLYRLGAELDSTRLEPIFIDGSRTASDPFELLALIAFEMQPEGSRSRALEKAHASTPRREAEADLALSALPPTQRFRARMERGASGPMSDGERLLVALREVEAATTGRKRRPVVLLDELPSSADAYTLFGRLRDELWRIPATWVIAGDVEEAATYLREPADAFFETVVRLDPLDDERATELLARRTHDAKPSKALIADLVGEGDGNPRRLVNLAREAILSGRRPEQLAAERSAREQTMSGLGESARRLAAELEAHGAASASDERLLARLGWTRSRATQVFRELEGAGVVGSSLERSGAGRPRKVYELMDRMASEARS